MVVRLLPLKDSLRLTGRGKDWTLQVMVRLSSMTTTRGAVEMVKVGAAGEEVWEVGDNFHIKTQTPMKCVYMFCSTQGQCR